MSFQLFTTHDLLGALNLYSKSPDASDDPAFVEGLVIAAHDSIAEAAAQQVDNLNQGMASRTVIGQATGILMERYDLDAARAVRPRLSARNAAERPPGRAAAFLQVRGGFFGHQPTSETAPDARDQMS